MRAARARQELEQQELEQQQQQLLAWLLLAPLLAWHLLSPTTSSSCLGRIGAPASDELLLGSCSLLYSVLRQQQQLGRTSSTNLTTAGPRVHELMHQRYASVTVSTRLS